ncbi:hypothetical protein [Streptomyces sp. NPDC006193]|uniref:hypothetical protein n=1 Tax=Streptomyces sp. NPDC006193 TaxID=3155717 RepID=UPI0033AB7D88
MPTTRKTAPHRSGAAVRATVAGVSAAVLAVLLTACNGADGSAAPPAGGKKATARSAGSAEAAGSATAGSDPVGTPTGGPAKGAGGGSSPSSPSAPSSPSSATAPTKPPAPAEPAASKPAGGGCDHKMPISPDEVAVYRYTPEGGSLSLIVRHGNWGCAPADSDGAPFETVGKETFIPMDQAAYITVTTPIVESTENQHIGVQEFLDWLEAHPNSGLVFTYHLGADGAIDRLDEVFTP